MCGVEANSRSRKLWYTCTDFISQHSDVRQEISHNLSRPKRINKHVRLGGRNGLCLKFPSALRSPRFLIGYTSHSKLGYTISAISGQCKMLNMLKNVYFYFGVVPTSLQADKSLLKLHTKQEYLLKLS